MLDRFTIGGVLSTGFSAWFRNFIPFTLIATLVYTPVIIALAVLLADPAAHIKTLEQWNLWMILPKLLLNSLVAAALTYGVVMELNGTKASFGACMSNGFSRMFPVMGVALLTLLVVMGGFILLIVPGIIVSLMLYVATPVAVVEKPGVVASLKRSRELTQGHKGSIFLLVLIVGMMSGAISTFLTMSFMKDGKHVPIESYPTYMWLMEVLEILSSTLGATIAAVAYTLLRREKEGTSTDALAAVFE